jgi:hypothetical protein
MEWVMNNDLGNAIDDKARWWYSDGGELKTTDALPTISPEDFQFQLFP